MPPLHIAIAGAGPAGLAAGLTLSRAGHRVTLYERFERPAPIGSGLILQPTGLTVLHSLGLLDRMLALGARIDRLHGADARTGRTVLDVRYAARPGGRFGLAVHRAALFEVLNEAALAEGIAIETATEIVGIDAATDTPSILTKQGRRIGPFDLVVDATGSRSVLRGQVDGSSEPCRLAYGAFWASLDWHDVGFDRHALLQRYQKASVMVGVLPIGRPSPKSNWMAAFFWSVKPDEADTIQAEGVEHWKAGVVDLWPACAPLVAQIASFEQMTLARYGHHTMRRPAARGIAFIGDAAHSTSPQLGQGANMALLDAAALAHALKENSSVDAALEAYVEARRRHVRLFQALSAMFTPFYQSDSTILPLLRDRLVATIANVPPAPAFLASMVAGTLVDPFASVGLREVDWSGQQQRTTGSSPF